MNILRPLRLAGLAACLAAAGAPAAGGPRGPKRLEITPDPPGEAVQVFTVRMTPSETAVYDEIRFECVYRQTFEQRRSSGRTVRRTVEPASHTHREREVRLVEDLDRYISFRVPIDLEELGRAYGPVFHTNGTVSVSRIRISALRAGETAWSVDTPDSSFRPAGAPVSP